MEKDHEWGNIDDWEEQDVGTSRQVRDEKCDNREVDL